MKIFVKNQEYSLVQNNFVASGGEANIYARYSTAYKVYHDPQKVIPIQKINELSKIKDKRVIIPQDIICDKQNNHIGYTMTLIKNATPVCQLFTTSFWNSRFN